jgi:glyoxylase-like metal-dependent hydrolase (beta-lactamase superfamily II)
MNSQTYRFKVGSFHCIAVSDGTHTYTPPTFPPPAIFLFANAPKEQLEQTLRQHDLQPEKWTEWVSPYICLVIDTGKHRVLVDTGAGSLAPSTGKLLQNLQAAGIALEDIDTVILTHGHPDHIGGNTDDEGKLVFTRAQYIMWKAEWDFWNSEEATNKLDENVRGVLVGYARKNLPPILRQLNLVDTETEILPGIQAIAAPGHTPGQMALAISSEGEQLLCVSDTVLHPVHLEQPGWCAAIDSDPVQVEATRRRILNKAAVDKALVMAFHFPFPGLGHVLRKGKAWQWQPIETTH